MKHFTFFKRSFQLLLLTAFLIIPLTTVRAQITTYPYLETFGSSGCGLPTGYSNSGSDPWDFQNTSESYMEGLDHTSNGGCFASMDDSGTAVDDSCLLTTPTFNLTSMPTPQLRFWWQNSNSTTSNPHTAGPRPWSNLYVDISTNGGTTWTRNVWHVTDSQQIGWVEGTVNLTSYVSTTTVIRFRGLETQNFQSDLSLDDIKIFQPQAWDAELVSIDAPTSLSCDDSMAVVSVTVQNNGLNAITSLPMYYQVDSGTVVSDTLTNTLSSGSSVGFTFTVPISGITAGSFNLKSWVDLPLDVIFINDTGFSAFSKPPTITSYPYFEDFENGTGGWQSGGSGSSWAFGTPAKATIIGASSGTGAFVTGGLGTGTYNASESSEVTSPCFDFTSVEGNLWVVLDVWWNSEFSWDGTVLQYSADSGITWTNVGAYNDPNNWYTDNSINGNPGGQQEGWSGRASSTNGSGGWVEAKHTLPASLVGLPHVLFRVAFGADGSIQDDGFAFDDFVIVDYTTISLDSHQTSFCGDSSSVDLVLHTSGINSWGDYLWNTSDTTDTLLVVNPGSYTVTFTDSILGLSSNSTTTIVNQEFPVITFASKLDSILIDSSMTLDPGLDPSLDALWSRGDTTHIILVKGTDYGVGSHQFNVVVSDSIGCMSTDSAVVVVFDITGINELTEASVRLYPNPVSDILFVEFTGLDERSVNLELYNATGQIIYTEKANSVMNTNLSIDLSNQESGVYLMVVRSGNEQVVQQIIKK